MHWLFLLLALGALWLAISTAHAWLMVLGLLASLALFVAWMRGSYSGVVGMPLAETATLLAGIGIKGASA